MILLSFLLNEAAPIVLCSLLGSCPGGVNDRVGSVCRVERRDESSAAPSLCSAWPSRVLIGAAAACWCTATGAVVVDEAGVPAPGGAAAAATAPEGLLMLAALKLLLRRVLLPYRGGKVTQAREVEEWRLLTIDRRLVDLPATGNDVPERLSLRIPPAIENREERAWGCAPRCCRELSTLALGKGAARVVLEMVEVVAFDSGWLLVLLLVLT